MDLYAYEQIKDTLQEILDNQELIKDKLGITDDEDDSDDENLEVEDGIGFE